MRGLHGPGRPPPPPPAALTCVFSPSRKACATRCRRKTPKSRCRFVSSTGHSSQSFRNRRYLVAAIAGHERTHVTYGRREGAGGAAHARCGAGRPRCAAVGGGTRGTALPSALPAGDSTEKGGWGRSQEAAPSTFPSLCPVGALRVSWESCQGEGGPQAAAVPPQAAKGRGLGSSARSSPRLRAYPVCPGAAGEQPGLPRSRARWLPSVGLCAAGEGTLSPRRCRCPGQAASSAARHSCLKAWLLAGLKPRRPCLVFPFSTRSAWGCTLAQSSSSWQADG